MQNSLWLYQLPTQCKLPLFPPRAHGEGLSPLPQALYPPKKPGRRAQVAGEKGRAKQRWSCSSLQERRKSSGEHGLSPCSCLHDSMMTTSSLSSASAKSSAFSCKRLLTLVSFSPQVPLTVEEPPIHLVVCRGCVGQK